MGTKFRVYLTTRRDPVPDLDTIKDCKGLESWKENIRPHAVKVLEYMSLGEGLIKDIHGQTIKECYAVIAYPHEKHEETANLSKANDLGRKMLSYLRDNSHRFKWAPEESGLSEASAEMQAEEQRFPGSSEFWDKFSYGLIDEEDLEEGDYEVDLEFVVDGPNILKGKI